MIDIISLPRPKGLDQLQMRSLREDEGEANATKYSDFMRWMNDNGGQS